MSLTKSQLNKASKIAERSMAKKLKTMSGSRLNDWLRFWGANLFDKRGKK